MELNDTFLSILDDCETQVKGELQINIIKQIIKRVENLGVSIAEIKFSNNDMHNISFQEFIKKFETIQDTSFDQEKIFPMLGILYVLHCAGTYNQPVHNDQKEEQNILDTNSSKHSKNYPIPPIDLISLRNLRSIETIVNYVLQTIYIDCLDSEAVVYLNLKPDQGSFVQGKTFWKHDSLRSYKTLLTILQVLLPLFKHQLTEDHLQRKFFTEIFCGLLQLGFSPVKKDLADVQYSREELNYFMEKKPLLILKSILLLRGIFAHRGGKGYIQAVCQSLFLRRYLLDSNGGLTSIIDVSFSLSSSNDLKHKQAIASLISLAKVPDEDLFYQILGPQILYLLHETEKNVDVFHILSLILYELSKRNSALVQCYIFEDLLKPLITLTQERPDEATYDSLAPRIITLHKVFLDMLPPDAELLAHLELVLCPIFEISTLPPTCHVKSKAYSLIERYLSRLNQDEIISTLLTLIGLQTNENSPQMNPNIKLIPKLNSIGIETRSFKHDWGEVDEKKIIFLIEVFEKLKQSNYIINFFQKLATFIDFTIFNTIPKTNNTLLVDADINEIKFERIRRLSLVVGIISSASENDKLTSKIFNDVNSALQIIKMLLETHHQKCMDVELAQIKDSCILSCVMLLLGYINTSQESKRTTLEYWNAFKDIVPTLKSIVEESTNAALSMFVKQLLNMIMTHGAVCSPLNDEEDKICSKEVKHRESKSFSEHHRINKNGSSTSSSSSKSSFTAPSGKSSLDESNCRLSSFREAFVDICSPHIAIRGHALISLNKLLESGDVKTLQNVDKIMSLFEYHLKDDDTYIYLAAIKGCSTLASKYPEKVISILTKEFTYGKHTTETRLKLVEILTETARNLGELLPKFKNLFLNCVLNGAKDEDGLIRASCFSNLGEICKLLHYSIESVIYEIFSLVECVINIEKCPEVKRAAVLLITMLLQGLGANSLKVLQSLMLDIYRGLKHIILTDKDPILVTHAELAMEEINSFTREFLRPKMNLNKKIYVTELPPNLL